MHVGEERQVCRGSPQAKTREEHENQQDGNKQVADLLGNAELCSQRMVLLEEQVVA